MRGNQGIKGSVHNISFDNLHASDFIRAYVKGMAEELYNMYAAFPEEIRKGRSEIAASGNGIRLNPLMAEETAKRFGMPVILENFRRKRRQGLQKRLWSFFLKGYRQSIPAVSAGSKRSTEYEWKADKTRRQD